MNDHPLLVAENVDVWFGSTCALQDVSISLSPGITALLGENGAGKSTLMRTLAGLIRPRRGGFRTAEGALDKASAWRQFGCSVGYMPQAVPVLRHLSVGQYLSYVAYLKEIARRDAAAEVSAVLTRVDLADRAGARTTKLSGGMRRRLGLAAALIGNPAVLLLDEPTVGLDPRQRTQMRELVRQLADERAVLLSTHLAEDVAAIADHVVVLDSGKTVFSGKLATFTSGDGPASAADVEQAFLQRLRETGG